MVSQQERHLKFNFRKFALLRCVKVTLPVRACNQVLVPLCLRQALQAARASWQSQRLQTVALATLQVPTRCTFAWPGAAGAGSAASWAPSPALPASGA